MFSSSREALEKKKVWERFGRMFCSALQQCGSWCGCVGASQRVFVNWFLTRWSWKCVHKFYVPTHQQIGECAGVQLFVICRQKYQPSINKSTVRMLRISIAGDFNKPAMVLKLTSYTKTAGWLLEAEHCWVCLSTCYWLKKSSSVKNNLSSKPIFKSNIPSVFLCSRERISSQWRSSLSPMINHYNKP